MNEVDNCYLCIPLWILVMWLFLVEVFPKIEAICVIIIIEADFESALQDVLTHLKRLDERKVVL